MKKTKEKLTGITITKDNLIGITVVQETGEIIFRIETGGEENAVNMMKGKIEITEVGRSTYKAPNIEWDQNYTEAF